MNLRKFYILFLLGVSVFLSFAAYNSREVNFPASRLNQDGDPDNSKIIKFDHKLHIKDVGIKCQECHVKVMESVSSKDNLNPKMVTCAGCHDIKVEQNCELCHFSKPYQKFQQKKWHLNFSHKLHLTDVKLECSYCHQGLDGVKYSKEAANRFPKMETCFQCHDKQNAATNCENCHTRLTNLFPPDHRQPNFLNEHQIMTDFTGNTNNNCMMCHSDNFCQVCHSPVDYSGQNMKTDFFAPYYTKEGAMRMDRSALQKLTSAHNLNYKYTHGLDANNKSYECKTCHDPVSFCASCHQNGGDLVTGFVPQSHQQPNFTTIGVNTGGGLHSKLAKQDLEQCASCHEVEGRDPVCVKCHFDNDGIKGTHPRTHEPGFLSDEKGIWHKTEGAVCYVCHTDPNARPNGIKGVKFCGYCHN